MLLHLEESIREFGLLLCTSQYVIERSIEYQFDRIKAKKLVAKSPFRNSMFSESYRIFYKIIFHYGDNSAGQISSGRGIDLLGPCENFHLSEYERVSHLGERLGRCFMRKFESLRLEDAKAIVSRVDEIKSFSRVHFVRGSDTQTVPVQKFRLLSETSEKRHRLRCFFAAEMDETKNSIDVCYGLLQDVSKIDLSNATSIEGLDGINWRTQYDLILADWSRWIQRECQGQVFVQRNVFGCFSGATVEDASVLKRLIGVMEHVVRSERPWLRSGVAQRGNQGINSRDYRGRKRIYIVEDRLLADHLLLEAKSIDCVNRSLKGVTR